MKPIQILGLFLIAKGVIYFAIYYWMYYGPFWGLADYFKRKFKKDE